MRPTLHTADVLQYAAAYTGEPYHALLCDPPYHLTNRTPDVKSCIDCGRVLVGADGKPDVCPRCGGTLIYQRSEGGRGFMGKTWDGGDLAFRPETWAAFMPLLYPGAFGMAFAGSRGLHRMMVAIEDAGYLIHPVIGWCYGSGFPKASRIDTQIDAAAGVERDVVGAHPNPGSTVPRQSMGDGWQPAPMITAPATDLARAWAGHRYGLQALKPALEFIVVFQKPYQGRPVDSMVATGAGALNIDGARVGTGERPAVVGHDGSIVNTLYQGGFGGSHAAGTTTQGRWPANLVLSHAPECEGIPIIDYSDPDDHHAKTVWECAPGCAVAALGAQSGERAAGAWPQGEVIREHAGAVPFGSNSYNPTRIETDTGTAARYFFQADYAAERLEAADPLFYCAKSSTAEREAGLSGREKVKMRPEGNEWSTTSMWNGENGDDAWRAKNPQHPRANIHPTCKPIALARHLATLLLPPALYAPRRLFIPFAGVASECIGAMQAGWDHVDGVELESEHVEIGQARIAWWAEQGVQLTLFDDSL